MKSVKVTLSNDIKSLEIHTFSDWHIGDVFCDMKAIKEQIEQVKNNPNAYVILNGDLMNNATKTSVSDCYAEDLTPMEQLQTLIDLLTPIADRILLATCGNHEARTYKSDGIDLTAMVLKQLGFEKRYCREGGVLFLRFGEETRHNRPMMYTIYATHGSGGGRKEGAKATRLADMASIIDCDIYIHGHTHLPMIMRQGFWRVDNKNSAVAHVDKLFVNTSAQLDYGGYGQTYEFKPSSKQTPIIYLNGTSKKFVARL